MKQLATLLLSLACAVAWSADFDVRAFGAKGDGTTKDTAAVQRALDACAQAGGGRVTVPPGTYLIGSVYLGDRTELHLQEGATLLGSPNLADYNAPDAAHLQKTHEAFFRIIREAQPELPIIIVSGPRDNTANAIKRRDIVKATYDRAVAAGDKHVYFVDGLGNKVGYAVTAGTAG